MRSETVIWGALGPGMSAVRQGKRSRRKIAALQAGGKGLGKVPVRYYLGVPLEARAAQQARHKLWSTPGVTHIEPNSTYAAQERKRHAARLAEADDWIAKVRKRKKPAK